MVLISIVIPTYNEAGNIQPLAQRIAKAFAGVDYELVFVDDASPDGTAKEIKALPGFGKTVAIVERQGKLGLASAVVDGARAARGGWIIVMDGDLSHPPETARKLIDACHGTELVVASRNVTDGGRKGLVASRDMISKGAEALCRPLVGSRTSDPLSGFFMIRRKTLLESRIRVRGYKILLNILYDNRNLRVKDVPYTFSMRYRGQTKLGAGEIINYVFDLGRLLVV